MSNDEKISNSYNRKKRLAVSILKDLGIWHESKHLIDLDNCTGQNETVEWEEYIAFYLSLQQLHIVEHLKDVQFKINLVHDREAPSTYFEDGI